MHCFVKRKSRSSVTGRWLVLLGLTLLLQPPAPADAEEASVGVLLRRARYAIAAGQSDDAAAALRAALAKEPLTRRGLEAALLLADVEFTRNDADQADAVLAAAERDFPDGDGSAQVLLARGWLAIARADTATAQRCFGLVPARSGERFTTELAVLGGAWARLAAAQPADDVPRELVKLAGGASDPVLRVAAGATLARAHAARGEFKQALHRLRALRRAVRGTSFSDDVELSIGLAQLDMGAPTRARRTFQRLAASTAAPSPAPPDLTSSGLTLADLRLPPAAFAARLARLYAARKERAAGLLTFFAGTFDRPARADAAAALSLADAAIAARKDA